MLYTEKTILEANETIPGTLRNGSAMVTGILLFKSCKIILLRPATITYKAYQEPIISLTRLSALSIAFDERNYRLLSLLIPSTGRQDKTKTSDSIFTRDWQQTVQLTFPNVRIDMYNIVTNSKQMQYSIKHPKIQN